MDPPIDAMSLFECYDQTLKSLVYNPASLAKVTIRSRPTAPWYDAGCVNVKANTRRLERFYRTRSTPTALDASSRQLKYERILHAGAVPRILD